MLAARWPRLPPLPMAAPVSADCGGSATLRHEDRRLLAPR
jgi:hypothetical protein